MQFMITYSLRPEHRDTAQARFKETGGLPPAGATMLNRWHDVAGLKGWVLMETTDQVAAARWIQQWTDLLTFDIAAIINDDEFMKVLA